MAFVNYKTANLAQSPILAAITNSATSVVTAASRGELFPSTFPFKAKIEEFDVGNVCIKREIVDVTARSGDVMTISRASEACPQSDTAYTQTATALAFSAGAIISLVGTKGSNDDLVAEVQRLETEKLNVADYQNGTKVYAATSTGTDAYAITLSPAPAALLTGMTFKFQADVANTGPATLNVNALGAKAIKKQHDNPLADGDIEAGQIVTVSYDGTNFQMDSQVATIPTVDINGLAEKLPVGDDDAFMVYDATALVNKKTKKGKLYAMNFGNGSDGDVTITTTVTLARDMFYNNLTINSPGVLDPNGYRVYVRGTLSGNGTIRRNGNNGTNGGDGLAGGGGGAGGAAAVTLNQGSLNAEVAAGAGGLGGNTTAGAGGGGGTSPNPSYSNVNGANGGTGGTNGGTSGGAEGTGGTATRGPLYNVVTTIQDLLYYFCSPASGAVAFPSTQYKGPASAAGGGGGGASSVDSTRRGGGGGGGGGNGGFIWIAAHTVNFTGAIESKGGNGGNGGSTTTAVSGGGGGGGGGNGGVIFAISRIYTSLGTVTLTAGTGGTAGTNTGGTGTPPTA